MKRLKKTIAARRLQVLQWEYDKERNVHYVIFRKDKN